MPAPDTLAELRAALAAQGAELAALRARVDRPRRRAPRRLVPLLLVALLAALAPLSLLAAGPFGDLNAGSPHNGNIQAIADAGITKGCDPPAFVSYCPNGLVTREEMASFLARTAGLGGNPPVANALTAVAAVTATNATSAVNATNATNATNAAQLGGQPASYYQAAGQPVANATNAGNAAQLGGQPPSFYQPAGQPIANATNAVNAQNAATVGGLAPNGLLRVARATGPSLVNPITLNSSSTTTITTITIAAPASGFVLVAGGTSITTGTDGVQVVLQLRDLSDGSPQGRLFATPNGTNRSGAVTATYAFQVDAAGTKTYVLEGLVFQPSGGAALAYFGSMTALYVPFGSTGTAAP